jgi:NAD(P)-dependent dehydrogenase (short-subunit alcohol dehydrogenase family)
MRATVTLRITLRSPIPLVFTGGANGIGLAICCRLAQEGARVFMADLDAAAAPAALDAVRSAAGGDADVHFVQARLTVSSLQLE